MSQTIELAPASRGGHQVLATSILGMIAGGLLGAAGLFPSLSLATPLTAPLPHQIPKYAGGISLRFAMVHDVLHERFPRHGPAYYRARNDAARRQLDALLAAAPSTTRPADAAWRLMDDLAVGHVHLGEYDRAVAIMRDKLARQGKLGITGRDLYPTYANLGTAMMIGALHQKGADGIPALRESLDWVRKSIEVNPEAHFGREVWQVALGEHLLAAAKDPTLYAQYDMIGNDLDAPVGGHGRAVYGIGWAGPRVSAALNQPIDDAERAALRRTIADVTWRSRERNDAPVAQPVPFDEPVLGIVGMWRYGGGANPHFSLALAETMVRVGQRPIAWSGYERTARLLEHFPDKGVAEKLTAHCRARQAAIESELPSDERSRLRPAFDADLKAGLDYQRAYQTYEEKWISEGASVDDPSFYKAFFDRHGDIASPAGRADYASWMPRDWIPRAVPLALLGGGLFGLPVALILRRERH